MVDKIFHSGNGQALIIPKELRSTATEVGIFKRGDEIVLSPRPKNLGLAFQLLTEMPDDFISDRQEASLLKEIGS